MIAQIPAVLNLLVRLKEVKISFRSRLGLSCFRDMEEDRPRLVLPLLPFNLGGRRSHQCRSPSSFCPATETFHRPLPRITVGTNVSADFQHHLFPDMQNSFLKNQVGREENTGASDCFKL